MGAARPRQRFSSELSARLNPPSPGGSAGVGVVRASRDGNLLEIRAGASERNSCWKGLGLKAFLVWPFENKGVLGRARRASSAPNREKAGWWWCGGGDSARLDPCALLLLPSLFARAACCLVAAGRREESSATKRRWPWTEKTQELRVWRRSVSEALTYKMARAGCGFRAYGIWD